MGFKFCRQRDSMSCGVACLQMICKYYGNNIDQRSLSNLCVPTNEGVSLFSLIKTAVQLGLNATSIGISISQFKGKT
jgi:ATP-binding cassette subfamily B protein